MNPFQSYRFFHGMRIRHLSLLMRCATQKTCQPGEVLFQQSQPIRHFILVKAGAVALRTPHSGVIETVRAGGVLGWACLIPEAAWEATGQALEPTTVTILDAASLLAASREDPDFGCDLLQRAAQWDLERLKKGATLPRIDLCPLPAAALQPRLENTTENVSDLEDALFLTPSDAEQLSVHDGQWVQLSDHHGSAILPVRINLGKDRHLGSKAQSAPFPRAAGIRVEPNHEFP